MPTIEDLNFTIEKLEFSKGAVLVLKFTEVEPSHHFLHVATHAIREALALAGHADGEIGIIVIGPDKDLCVALLKDPEAAQ